LYRREQLLSLMNIKKSRSRTRLTDEHLQECMPVSATEIKADTEKLLKHKQ
jgi:hypothetical protein